MGVGVKREGGDAFLSLKQKMYVVPFIILNYVWVCLSACGYVHVSAGAHGGQKHPVPKSWSYRQFCTAWHRLGD